MISINARTRLYCLFGRPAKHSLSPAMQNAAFSAMGINAVYLTFEISSLGQAVQAMRTLPIHGASVTIPFKSEIIPYLDDVEPAARRMGAVNTLVLSGDLIKGHNTDGYGALQALTNNGVSPHGATVLVAGNGGSARSIAHALMDEGASVFIAGRNSRRVSVLVDDLKKGHGSAEGILLEELTPGFTARIDVIINTTPVGMAPDTEACVLPENLLHSSHVVMDIVYTPLKTVLLAAAERKGCRALNGLEMLLYQGARQFEIWTGLHAPVVVMRNALLESLEGGQCPA